MHLHFEQNTSAKCDCSILSLSWMGKVPDELPEDEGWKLNRTNYYQEGWLATGNVRGVVGVTFTSSHCRKNAEVPVRTNYNLRGHRSEVILVKWNEPYQKLASCDSSGVIFVWIKYEGRWSIELINDRNTPVTHFSWSHDGRMALICYQDGFVLVGSVAGQRYWSSMLNLEATITCGIWTPDDQQVYFGTTLGQIIVMDVHGAMVSQVQLQPVGITSMAWSCEKFKMEEGEDTEPGVANVSERSFVLAVSFQNGHIYLLKNYDDVSPVHIHTEFDGRSMAMEWSNSRELLAVAGALMDGEGRGQDPPVYSNIVKFYSDSGILLYTTPIPSSQMPVSAMTWGHNDRRVFVATGTGVQVARAWRRVGSLQLLARLRVRQALRRPAHLAKLPLPPRLAALVASLFTHTISCCVPEATAVREFVSRAACSGRLHCTMLRRSSEGGAQGVQGAQGVSYTLYLEHLGGLVPLLKGRRISKIRPEFVIYDPQYEGADSDDIHWFLVRSSADVPISCSSSAHSSNTSSSSSHPTNSCHVSDSSDTDREEGCTGSPRLQRRRKGRHRNPKPPPPAEKETTDNLDELGYIDSLPEDLPLVEVTSNIWGTKFKIHGLAKNIPANLGQVTYKTSLLHLQPRQMTLVMTELRDNFPIGPDPNFNPNIFSEDEEEVFQLGGDQPSKLKHQKQSDTATVIAPMSPRGNLLSRAKSSLLNHNNPTQSDNANSNSLPTNMIPALARAESYEDEFPYIDLTEMVNFCESLRINGTNVHTTTKTQNKELNLIQGNYSRSQIEASQQYSPSSSIRNHSSSSSGLGRSNGSSSSQRSGSSHCPGRHAISPLCCEGSVPTLQSPKNAVAPSDIIFDRPPAQTMMSYHSTNPDFSQNIQQVKSSMATSDNHHNHHNHQPTFNLNLSLDHNRQVLIKKMDSHLETMSNRMMNGNRAETNLTQANIHTQRSNNSQSEGHSSSFLKHFRCNERKDRMPSPNCESRRDDLKYIDEETNGNSPCEVSMESSSIHRTSNVPITPVGIPVATANISDTMIRSCSVGYLDVVQSQLVPCEVTLAMLRKEAPKRLVLVNKKNKNICNKRNVRKHNNLTPSLNLKLDEKKIQSGLTWRTPHLKSCGKSKSLDSSDMFLMTHSNGNEMPTLPASIEEPIKSINEENEYESIETVKCSEIPLHISNNNRKEMTKLSFFTSCKTPVMNRLKRRDLPVCESCKCVTPPLLSSAPPEANGDAYICNACISSSACNTPSKKSKGFFKDKHSPRSDKSRSSSPRHISERNNYSEIEIERATTPSGCEQRSLSGAALATLEQLLYRVRDRASGSGGGSSSGTPPPSPALRSRLPRSSPASPAPAKKNKRTASASPIRKHLLNSPLLNRRRNKNKNQESSDDEVAAFSGDEVVNGKNYRDLETFQKAQLRQKLKRGKIEPMGSGGSWASQPAPVRREFVMHNKAPMWNESSQVYQLDFGGRVTQESAKNFQIEFRGKQVMQFGRIDGNAYTLDFQYPFSALQAFAVALANVTQRLK